MSVTAVPANVARKSSQSLRVWLWSVVVVWFLTVSVFGANDFFVAARGTPPLALLFAAGSPVVLSVLAIALSASIREFALTLDVKVLTSVQAWRIGGYSFLILSSYGYLPGYFAWPAAVGDMFIGVTAPLLLGKLKNPSFARSRTFVAWNVLGIVDLVVAVGIGALGSLLAGSAEVLPTTLMSRMPLVLVPTFFVPTFLVLHLVALLQAFEQRKSWK